MASVGGAALRLIATVAIANLGVASLGLRICAADTLEWALGQAYQNNPQLNAQRAAARAQDEGVPQALSGYRPRASLTASVATQNQKILARTPSSRPIRSA
jgi:outer membrane protein